MRKVKTLILTGGEWHNFDLCGGILQEFLEQAGWTVPTLTSDREVLASPRLAGFDALIFYTQGGTLTAQQLDGLLSFVRGGKGFLGIHCAADSFTTNREYVDMIGCVFADHPPIHEFRVEVSDSDHMLGRRIQPFEITDELYILKYDPALVDTVLHTYWKGRKEPILYTKPFGRGKVCYLALGHDERAFRHPVFQRLVIRAVGFVTGQREGKAVICGVIGYGGQFGMGKGHVEWINATPGLKAVAVCDIDPSRTEQAKKDFPGIETYTNPDVMLDKTKAQLVTIVTPHNTHFQLARSALRAGKHVVLEKPMCITAKQATTLINLAKRNRVVLSVFHNRRWDGDYLAIRYVVDSGLIGDVFHVEAFHGNYGYPGNWWRSDKEISGGVMYDWGVHYIDWILNLVRDPIVNVTGFFHKRVWHAVTNEDQGHAIIRFERGQVADLQVSHIACAPKPKWRILGERGAIIYWHDTRQLHVYGHVHGGDIESKMPIKETEWALPYYRDLANHLLLGEPLEVKPEQARRNIAVLEAAEESSKSGASVVPAYN